MKNETIGPIGPTTSSRMDKFSEFVANQGVIAVIGKGERSLEAKNILINNNVKYFTVYGGVAACLASCIKKCKCIGYEDLGAEAIYELEVEHFPLDCCF